MNTKTEIIQEFKERFIDERPAAKALGKAIETTACIREAEEAEQWLSHALDQVEKQTREEMIKEHEEFNFCNCARCREKRINDTYNLALKPKEKNK